MTTDMQVLTYSLKQKDKHVIEPFLDDVPVVCYSMASNFIGLAVMEKGVRYFFPKGSKIMRIKGELICFVHEYVGVENPISEPIESMAEL